MTRSIDWWRIVEDHGKQLDWSLVGQNQTQYQEQLRALAAEQKKRQQFLAEHSNTASANSPSSVQHFGSGATRSADAGKIDYEGFLSLPALEAYGQYMLKHQVQADGTVRSSSNWKLGIPLTGDGSYTKALFRHVFELTGLTVGHVSARLRREMPNATMRTMMQDTACAVLFNIQGFLHEFLKQQAFAQDVQQTP